MKEELTEKMHSEFTIDKETEIRHKASCVWDGYTEYKSMEEVKKTAESYGITLEQALKYKDYWESLKGQKEEDINGKDEDDYLLDYIENFNINEREDRKKEAIDNIAKYYKGEDKNPYEGKDKDKTIFWDAEKRYVDLYVEKEYGDMAYCFGEIPRKIYDWYFHSNGYKKIHPHLLGLLYDVFQKRGEQLSEFEDFLKIYLKK